ncbi:MAG: hypothetical protein KJI72_03265 [Patescibacteria group bacterium]|nr:hypothetical protein [Patescibacteria group bacterium]
MGTKLSHVLLDLGFFSALGTSEVPGAIGDVFVKYGTPNTYDDNNGVTVIYDEEGRPWIIANTRFFNKTQHEDFQSHFRSTLTELVKKYQLKLGAYVPQSNHGCSFIHKLLPTL